MIIECPQCRRKYRIEDSRVPAQGTVARCGGCGHRFPVHPLEPEEGITCPKCGARQPSGDECTSCGVIFSKIPPGAKEVDTQESSVPVTPETVAVTTAPNGEGAVFPAGVFHSGGSVPVSHGAPFPIGGAFRFGWDRVRGHLGFFVVFLALGFLLILVPCFLADVATERAPAVTLVLFRAVDLIIEATVTMGCIKVGLRVCDGEKPDLSNLLDCMPLFFKYSFATLLYGLIVFAGLLLFIIPGMVWAIRYMFFAYFIVDAGKGPWESLKSSAAITRNVKLDLFLLALALTGINVLGLLALGVGLFVTIPLSLVASAYVFRGLQKQSPQTE
ncbi:MAG: hypothetical protein GX443_00975 [Deltaproteobacteria bacterium]|nr:hypothetical protein [Deltaproteobacteria bacterium]